MDVYGAVGPAWEIPLKSIYSLPRRARRRRDGKHLDIVVIPVGHVQPPAVRADNGRDRLGEWWSSSSVDAVGAAGKGRQRAALVIDGVSRYRSVALVGDINALRRPSP